jgi:hypothetical protein
MVGLITGLLDRVAGLPSDFIENLKTSGDGKKIVTMKYPDSLPGKFRQISS